MKKNVVMDILQDKRVLLLILLTLGAVIFVFANGGPFDGGLKFGIDFSGGLRIPISLEQPVSNAVMSDIVETIGKRTKTFGLVEVRVTPVGDSEIYVEVPKTIPHLVSDIEFLLSKQGVYLGIVDGKVAVTGDVLLSNIRKIDPSYLKRSGQSADWGVSFSLNNEGQKHFLDTVRGKANYPLYMYVDRPTDAIIVISEKDLLAKANISSDTTIIGVQDALKLAKDAIRLDDSPVPIYLESELDQNMQYLKPKTNKTKALISANASEEIKNKLTKLGYKLDEKDENEMQPKYSFGAGGSIEESVVDVWKAVGLRSAPRLRGGVTETASPAYTITGPAEGYGRERLLDADRKARETMAILKGGALPVQITLGSVQEVPATFGKEVLKLSLIGLVFSVLCISIMVGLRYKRLVVVLPIVFTSISEIILLTTIIGLFSIDLAAMAGIIAAVGISVDAQVVITDELLKRKEGEDPQNRLDKAFHIIMTNAIVAIVAMAPLLLVSGLVQIIGFATTTVIGYVLGVAISRPAYGAIAKKLFYD